MRRRRGTSRPRNFERKYFPNRLLAAQAITACLFLVMIARLFQLQVVQGEYYFDKAIAQRTSSIEIPARRGEILVKDQDTGNLIKLATNTTLDLIYVDPMVTPDKRLVADTLAPILYTDEDFAACEEEPKFCPEGSVQYIEPDSEDPLARPLVQTPTREEAVLAYADTIFRKINREKVDFITLKSGVDDETLTAIDNMKLSGIGIIRESSLVYTDPTKVPQNLNAREKIADALTPLLDMPIETLIDRMKLKDLRYVKLKNKIRPEITEQIREIKALSKETYNKSRMDIISKKLDAEPTPDYFRGVVLIPEHWRYYPDDSLASQIIGFVNREGKGQYGIEGKFDRVLAGKNGMIESQNDVSGYGIDPLSVQNAEDGVDIVLTIDRVVQKKVEDILNEATTRFKADSGQAIVMDPTTGRIIALANSPGFNPNDFGEALFLERTKAEEAKDIFPTTPLFIKDEHGRFQQTTFEAFDEAWRLEFDPEFFVYRNRLGPGAFVNRTIQEVYEPGSVFKPLVMAIAIETAEVTPNTTFNEDGPIEIGNFLIKTALGEYNGIQTMTNVLETSSNVGMVFIAFKLGKSVMHNFLTDRFGFGQYTDIALADEEPGTIRPKREWSDALLATSSFGQGLTVTPMQIIRAWAVLANGGMLVQPTIVQEEIYPNGKSVTYSSQQMRRIFSPDTATTLTNMLVSAVDNGVAWPARIPGYSVAGKTGTSQIAGPDGKYATGEGSFITSFAGYAPALEPRYLVLVKFDRPRYGADSTWGSTTAAPVFKEIMEFLLDYGNVQPEQEIQ